ncbi:hypothetical protein NLM31_12880 [Bradyrhizobium sp. CCGUVB4N]|uniref:hypothetical protein n=1 Tax=Bradyrhizobium sp. CCGUVB4N TaxID=2949631 RepID=UPI0020B3E813|nr:hypothetical protein [Bradyrhizobium sp. CCGUVB4N]MCP3381235.1 hypothetical protein [Bradyrhizobium sp. CCGUVB4N]
MKFVAEFLRAFSLAILLFGGFTGMAMGASTESAAKLEGYAVLNASGPQAAKLEGYAVLMATGPQLTKLVGYVVLQHRRGQVGIVQ